MKYVIMCGGNYENLETPKQLSKVNGEILVARTIRLLKENGITDIAITSKDKRFDNFGVERIEHKNDFISKDKKKIKGYWVDAFLPSEDPITYLYGDVYYSDEAIKTIINTETDYILFFASKNIYHKEYSRNWEEPFAFKVVNQKRFRRAIEYCKHEVDRGHCNREPISWEVYRAVNHYDLNTHTIGKNFIAIDDYTVDIDCPEDIKELEKVLKGGGISGKRR